MWISGWIICYGLWMEDGNELCRDIIENMEFSGLDVGYGYCMYVFSVGMLCCVVGVAISNEMF